MKVVTDNLQQQWGTEWTQLTIAQQIVIEADYFVAPHAAQTNYQRNIGVGNLASYANTLLVDAAKDWVTKVTPLVTKTGKVLSDADIEALSGPRSASAASELIAGLRAWQEVDEDQEIHGMAADRLETLISAQEQWILCEQENTALRVEAKRLDNLRPTCPTCNGTRDVYSDSAPPASNGGWREPDQCPDCLDGRMSWEWLAKLGAEVFRPGWGKYVNDQLSAKRATMTRPADLRAQAHRLWDDSDRVPLFEAADELEYLDNLRPPCPTCGGTGNVHPERSLYDFTDPCPDCPDGRMSWEDVVGLLKQELNDTNATYAWQAYLRSVRP